MLDGRVYRTAFLPALVALFIAAFALQDRPNPARSSLPADVFDGARAMQSLNALPAGDAALADHVARVLGAPDERGERPVFTVRRDGDTVIATRPGISDRRIVVLADRDANGLAERSGTAALLELGRVFKSRELHKTLVLVSTTGARSGFGGVRAWAKTEAGGPVDAVIVLGDFAGAGIRKPWVVAWPSDSSSVALSLERTVQVAVRREVHSEPGGPHAFGQWMRRAVPVTVSAQGPIAAAGLPAVMVSGAGEIGPAPADPVLDTRLAAFGRAVVRTVSAIDAAGPTSRRAGIITLRNVLPDWSVRLVIGTLLLPALLAALDAFARARRRRVAVAPWLAWLAVAAVPLPVAWLWLRLLGATDLLDVPDGPVLPDRYPLQTSGIVALATAALAAALATWALRAVASRRARSATSVEGLAVATSIWLCGLMALAWLVNPYAAALVLVAAHLWLFAAAGWRVRATLPALLAGLALPLLALVYLMLALRLGPHELAWGAALGAGSGAGLGTTLLFAGLLAGAAGVLRVALARRRNGEHESRGANIRTRGPLSYAGPGSLGGTESALRR